MLSKLTIFGSTHDCVWCVKAVQLCREKGVDFDFIDITGREDLKDHVREVWGSKPYICEGERTIGGYAELQKELS